MKLWTLVVFAALAASACSGGDGSVSETTTSTISAPTATTTASTTTTTLTTSTEATSTTLGSVFVIGQAGYVLGAGGTIQSVSPDARVLVIADGEHVGLQPLDGSDPEVVPAPSEFFFLGGMKGGWTPDGSMMAFHDSWSTALERGDSTVWLLDTREPSLRSLVSEQDIYVFDVAIAADGEVILQGFQTGRHDGVFTVSESGEPEPLAPVIGFTTIEWLPDVSALLVPGLLGDQGGLWKVDPTDGSSELVTPTDDVLGTLGLVAVSGDSAWALIYYRGYVEREFPANVSHYGVVRLETGEVFPLKEREDRDFFGPGLAAFSPDGVWVAYTYYDGQDMDAPLVLAVRPTAGGEEQIISGDLFRAVGSPPTPQTLDLRIPVAPFLLGLLDGDLGPVWGADNRLVLPTGTWALVINLE